MAPDQITLNLYIFASFDPARIGTYAVSNRLSVPMSLILYLCNTRTVLGP